MRLKPRSTIARAAVLARAIGVTTIIATPAKGYVLLVSDAAHTAQTIIHYVGRLYEIYQKYVQIQNQYYQIRNQLQMLKKLDRYWARNIVYTMEFMEDLMARHGLPTHMDPSVHQLHPLLYPGWTPPVDYWSERRETSTQTLATMRQSLAAQHIAFKTARDHIRTLLELKQQLRSVKGTEEVLEVVGGMVAWNGEVANLAQLSASTSADAATAYYSYLVSSQARQERAIEEALRPRPVANPNAPGWNARPDWWGGL